MPDSMPKVSRRTAGQAKVIDPVHAPSLPAKSGQQRWIDAFPNRRAADHHQVPTPLPTAFNTSHVVIRIIGFPGLAKGVDEEIDEDQADRKEDDDPITDEPARMQKEKGKRKKEK